MCNEGFKGRVSWECRRGCCLLSPAIGFLGSIFGALAAFGGVMLTQRRSDRRDESAWAREREREHARWTREDAARTFELKREAYITYFDAVGQYRDGLGKV